MWTEKIAAIQETVDLLAPIAFRETPNAADPVYVDTFILPVGTGDATLRLGTGSLARYMISPSYDLGDIGNTVRIKFSAGAVASGNDKYPCLLLLDTDGEYSSYYVANANPRTVEITVSASYKAVRLVFPAVNLVDAYIKKADTDTFLFNGNAINTGLIKRPEDLVTNTLLPSTWRVNSRGDYIGFNFAASDAAGTAQQTAIGYPMFKKIGASATPFSYSISKVVALPKGSNSLSVEFSAGEVDTSLVLRLLNPSAGTANYYTANAIPRTVTIDTTTWTHVQLYFKTSKYASCYIKDATNNTMLWEGAASTD